MSWDDDEYEVQLPPETKATPAPVAESWEDEVDRTLDAAPAPAPAAGPAAPVQVKNKHIAKERARKAEEERAADRAALDEDEQPPEDPVLRKKWLEDREKASDLALAAEALGLGGMAGGKVAPGGGLEGLCSDMALFSAEKFRDAGKRLGTRVCEVGISASGSSDKARGFMKELVGSAGEFLSLEDLKEIGLMLDTLRNRKQAEIKASTKGGAKGATATKAKAKKAGSLMVERDEIAAYDDIATDFSGGGAAKAGEWKVDDGDFM